MQSVITAGCGILSVIYCSNSLALASPADIKNTTDSDSRIVRFIAIGDTGTGKPDQYAVASAVEEVCASRGCDFALGLGDNIYSKGVTSTNDPQFIDKFEQPYKHLNFPFYMTLGNHDNPVEKGFMENDKGNFEVAYSYKKDRESDKWHMPARYYSFNEPEGDAPPLVTFISLDAVAMAENVNTDSAFWDLSYRDQEADWIDTELKDSKAPWKIVFSHFPYISNGKHGNAGNYGGNKGQGSMYYGMVRDHVCNKADVIMAGHDHDLQWLKPVAECGKTSHIVSGAGARMRSIADDDRNDAYWQEGDVLGFFYIEIHGDELHGTVYTVDADTGEYKEAFSRTIEHRS